MNSKPLNKSRGIKIIVTVILILLIKILSLNRNWIEDHYATGFFAGFSVFLRMITGWLPFSLGDIIYLLAGAWLLWKFTRIIIKIFKKQVSWRYVGSSFLKLFFILMGVYILFNIFWGLNYDRKGIVYQLGFSSTKYDTADLKNIDLLLLQKVNESKQALLDHHTIYPTKKELFSRAAECYTQAQKQYSFLKYNPTSVKSSLYGWWGNYLGFTGYYNPFTGEAQVNTTVPKFLLPYTTCHEMAHQLGYAKEDEANFVGYLAATSSSDTLFHYSTYLDLFLYANREVFFVDSSAAKLTAKLLLPQVKADIKEWRDFAKAHRSPAEPFITWAYGRYLKANRQPMGMRTYDEVIADLIAFYKKFGRI